MKNNSASQQLVTTPLSEQLMQILSERITNLVYPIGSKIDVERLKTEHGVSHIPIRDALHKLAEQGLVVVIPRIGYFTADYSLDEIDELFDVRKLIEVYAVGRCIKNLDMEQLKSLRNSCEKWQGKSEAEKSSAIGFFEIGEALHRDVIVGGSGSPLVIKFYRDIWNKIKIVSRMRYLPVEETNKYVTIPPEDTDEHLTIIDALLQENKVAAKKALIKNLAAAKERIFSSFEKRESEVS